MALHLSGKIARLIADFGSICDLVDLIDHELEKRVVARHGLVKLDALLDLLPRLKNEVRINHFGGDRKSVARLDVLIGRLRRDYTGSDMEAARDALAAHALKLDLMRIVDTWRTMGYTTFGVLRSDLQEIDTELERLGIGYSPAGTTSLDPTWPAVWARANLLGSPDDPRFATIYPSLATAGICGALPGGVAPQDATIRAIGIATFLRQTRLLWDPVDSTSTVGRLLAEIALNDYLALWELLFTSGITNEHGAIDQSVLEHWTMDGWKGATCLAQLEHDAHPAIASWRQIRNKFTAHTDPDEEIWKGDIERWPMAPAELFDEALRVIERFRTCAQADIRSKLIFWVPQPVPSLGLQNGPAVLAGQEGRRWRDD